MPAAALSGVAGLSVAPRSAGGIEPAGSAGQRELGALHQRLQANPIDLDGWAALGQLYLYRNEYDNALLAYQRLVLLEGASAATQAAQATVLYSPGGPAADPGRRCACSRARSSRTRVR